MNYSVSHARRLDLEDNFRTAVNPSLGAAGKTSASCFSRSGNCLPDPASFERPYT
jgi:hypothetical protein